MMRLERRGARTERTPQLFTATGPLFSLLPAPAFRPSPQGLLLHRLQGRASPRGLLRPQPGRPFPRASFRKRLAEGFQTGRAARLPKATGLGDTQRTTLGHFLLSKELRNEEKNRKVYCSMLACPFLSYNCWYSSSK